MAEEVTQITRPSPIIEEAQKNYLDALKDQVATPLDTSQFAPSVVGKTALDQAIQQQQAKAAGLGELQFDKTGAVTGIGDDGVASFKPFLDTAQTTLGGVQPFIDAAGTQFGTQAGFMGPTAYEAFESPYQKSVRDATLASFKEQADIREQAIRDQQAQLGVLGAGRAGVQLSEFGTGAARERALLQAGLQQQGFQDAVARRQQDLANRQGLAQSRLGIGQQELGLGQFQSGLASQVPGLQQADIQTLGQVGAAQQAQSQAQLDASREAARMAAFEPQERVGFYGQGVTGLMGGYPAQTTTTNIPNPTPLQTALGVGSTLAGIYGTVKNAGVPFSGFKLPGQN